MRTLASIFLGAAIGTFYGGLIIFVWESTVALGTKVCLSAVVLLTLAGTMMLLDAIYGDAGK